MPVARPENPSSCVQGACTPPEIMAGYRQRECSENDLGETFNYELPCIISSLERLKANVALSRRNPVSSLQRHGMRPKKTLMKRYIVLTGFILTLLYLTGLPAQATPSRLHSSDRMQDLTLGGKATPTIPDLNAWLGPKGHMSKKGWSHAAQFTLPYEINPGHNAPAPVQTHAEIGYTEKAIWVRFIARDPHPANIRVRFRQHDDISSASVDYVGIYFSPFNDTQWAYQFFCTAGGVEYDAFDQQNSHYSSFNAVWSCKAKKTDFGYQVVMRIPFGSIKFPHSNHPQSWRLMLFRNWPRNLRHQISNREMDYNSNCTLCQMQTVHTATPVKANSANVQIIPSVTLSRTDNYNPTTNKHEKGAPKLNASVDARWIIRPNMEWDATLNPNFSEVAPDVLQLSVNRRFALYYPENRPFFQQGTQVFNTPLNLVDTRQIVDPHSATKLVGQIGSSVLGVLLANDSQTNILLPGQQNSSLDSFSFGSKDALVRYRYDIGNSSVGILGTGRDGSGYRNGVVGVDTNWQIDQSDNLTAQVASSTTRYSDQVANAFSIPAGTISGQAWTADFHHNVRAYNYRVGVSHIANTFRADLGYMPQVGYNQLRAGGEYDFYAPDSDWYQYAGFGAFMHWTRSTGSGPLLDSQLKPYAFMHGPFQTHFIIYASQNRQYVDGKTFSLRQYEFQASAQPTDWLDGRIDVTSGDGVDYIGARKGRLLSISSSFGLMPGRHLKIDLVDDFERLTLQAGRLYTADLYDLRIAWYFTSRLYMRLVGQEQNVRNNISLYPPNTPSRSRNVATQWIIGYQVNPWTGLYAGIADGYLGTGNGPLISQQRKFFLKANYYFQP